MSQDYKKEARKQYLKYFSVWFIVVGILVIITFTIRGLRSFTGNQSRGNTKAPTERVYDDAGVLSSAEEQKLRNQIEKIENSIKMDIVIVTIDQPMEGSEAKAQHGAASSRLEDVMLAYADNFWDDNHYGYDKSYEGDGVILVLNKYEGQEYICISTSGMAERKLSDHDINQLTDVFAKYYRSDVYKAYSELVDAVEDKLDNRGSAPLPWALVIILPVFIAAGYALTNLRQPKAKDTTTANTYVSGGQPIMTDRRDDFLRKNVTTRHIQRSSSSSSGGSSRSGGGGHHHSRSGASHGGGGRRL